jgi:uncharacterized protein (DUF427 family)
MGMKAVWNGKLLAVSEDVIRVERDWYFPRKSLRKEYFKPSVSRRVNAWLGEAHFFDISVDGKLNADAAWWFPKPKPQAKNVEGRVAFAKNVEIFKD